MVGGEKRVCIKSWRERRKKIECEPRPTPAQRCARKPPPSIHQLPSHLRPPSLSVGGWRRRRRKMSTSNALAKILSRGKFSLLPSCRGKREGRVRACRALICQPPRGRSLPPPPSLPAQGGAFPPSFSKWDFLLPPTSHRRRQRPLPDFHHGPFFLLSFSLHLRREGRESKEGEIIKICHSASPPRVRWAGGGRAIAFREFLFPLPFSISFLLPFLLPPFPYPSLFLH